MDHLISRDTEFELDLETGETSTEEETTKELLPCNHKGNIFNRARSANLSFDKPVNHEYGTSLCRASSNLCEVADDNVELLIHKLSEGEDRHEYLTLLENKYARDKRKKMDARNPSKPPRPPNGPSLDVADHKFVREITELAMRKRARIEQMKALKKMKAVKASSSSSSHSSLSAMVITILFCAVIIYQGVFSRSSATNKTSDPSFGTREGFISVRNYSNGSADKSYY